MPRLHIRRFAEQRGYTLSSLYAAVCRKLDPPITMGTMRRYWYSAQDGKENGAPIRLVDIKLMQTFCDILGVSLDDLAPFDADDRAAA